MQYVKLNTGIEIPALGIGTWNSQPNEVYNAIRTAISVGFRHIDCAYIYNNEKEVGKALKEAIAAGDVKREEIFITSKLWNDSHHKNDVKPALEKTLSDLNLDYIDLYLIHWPVAIKKGLCMPSCEDNFISLEQLPLSETWLAMEEVYEAGLAKNIGVSNFSIKKLEDMKKYASIIPAMNQIESHPFLAQNEMLEYCRKNGIAMTAYSPLGSPASHRESDEPDVPVLLKNETILAIAKKHNATAAQVLIKWSLQRGVIAIPKSVSKLRIEENFNSIYVQLDEEDMSQIAALNRNFRYLEGSIFCCAAKGYTLETLWDF